jgi:transposase-like protein
VWAKGATADAPERLHVGETLEQEVRRLRRENETLRQEQAFAKKVAVYFAKESR